MVVDDEALVRLGFGHILGPSEDIEVVASASGGDAVLRELRAMPDPPVVVMPATFLLKDTEPGQLAQLFRTLAPGGVVLTLKASRTPMHSHPGTETAVDAEAARERDALVVVAEGLSNVGIGARIHLGAGTVKDHVSAILTKLRVTSRGQAGLLDERPRSEAGR
ncbi:response regulator transcription factor [Streptomyces sp. NPDC050211]|uniref:response regulator transcription factor n=1 Tax=Streptomyces sp. NPDC050211 TaxID=3154932 RepID=UPI0034300114